MDRGLILKCLHCDSDAFHILYTMEPELGGVLLPRQSGSYESVSSVAMSRTKWSKRPWRRKSSGNVRLMHRG